MKKFLFLTLLLFLPTMAIGNDLDDLSKALDAYIQHWSRFAPGSQGAPTPYDFYILIQARYAIDRIKSGKSSGPAAAALPPQLDAEMYPEASQFELLPPPPPPPKGLSQKEIQERKRKWKEWQQKRLSEWGK